MNIDILVDSLRPLFQSNNSTDADEDRVMVGNERFHQMVKENKYAFYALFLVMGILPIMVVIILPFYNIHMDKKKRRLEEERRLMSTKLAAPVREDYLNELMADYSMVLVKSDFADYDSEDEEEEDLVNSKAEETSVEAPTLSSSSSDADTSVDSNENNDNENKLSDNDDIEMQLSQPSDDIDERKDNNRNDNIDGDLAANDDIEMQKPKENCSVESKQETYYFEDDNSACNFRTIYVPLPGQKNTACIECKRDTSRRDTSKRDTSKRGNSKRDMNMPASDTAVVPGKRAHSDGCTVCLNPFEVGQTVTWSSNPTCPHVFHQECMMDWFSAVGTKVWNDDVSRRERLKEPDNRDIETIKKQICNFPTKCPFCRQDFFLEGNCKEGDGETSSPITEDEGNVGSSSEVSLPVL